MATKTSYPANLEIAYSDKLDRVSTLFRLVLAIPIVIVLSILSGSGTQTVVVEAGNEMVSTSSGIMGALSMVTALMILFRQRYPRWWFDFALELTRFSTRVGAYVFLLTDQYPSTVEKQAVTVDVTYPDVKKDLSQWLPLVKWLLAFPHYIVLAVLIVVAVFATVIGWFSILFTGRYPRRLFDYVVGVGRWSLRVNAYAFLLVTDKYPPFSLK